MNSKHNGSRLAPPHLICLGFASRSRRLACKPCGLSWLVPFATRTIVPSHKTRHLVRFCSAECKSAPPLLRGGRVLLGKYAQPTVTLTVMTKLVGTRSLCPPYNYSDCTVCKKEYRKVI